MGAWGTNILDNDTSNGVYEDFMDLYAEEIPITEINKKLIEENYDSINDEYDSSNFWFGLALAQWETKSLDNDVFIKVKNIIESESDLKAWKDLEASASSVRKRKSVLRKFLEKIRIEKKKAISRDEIKIKPIFNKGDCLTFKLDNGNYGGCIILAADMETRFGYGKNLIATTRINQVSIPTIDDFLNSELLITSYNPRHVEKARTQIVWHQPGLYKKNYSDIYSFVGNIEVKTVYIYDGTTYFGTAGWQGCQREANGQFEFENAGNKKPDKKVVIKSII